MRSRGYTDPIGSGKSWNILAVDKNGFTIRRDGPSGQKQKRNY